MRVRIAVYLLALLFVAIPSPPRVSSPVAPTQGPSLRIEPEAHNIPAPRAALALVLISGLGLEVVSRRRAR